MFLVFDSSDQGTTAAGVWLQNQREGQLVDDVVYRTATTDDFGTRNIDSELAHQDLLSDFTGLEMKGTRSIDHLGTGRLKCCEQGMGVGDGAIISS